MSIIQDYNFFICFSNKAMIFDLPFTDLLQNVI